MENSTAQHPESISGKELRAILKAWGYNQSDFCRHLGKYNNYFTDVLLPSKQIPYKLIDAVKNFIGQENFEIALEEIKKIRQKPIQERKFRGFPTV